MRARTLAANCSGRSHWQYAAKLMLDAADGGSVAAASEHIERALFLDMRLDVRRIPAPPAPRKRNVIVSI